MGMDVMGISPSKKCGEYFRANVWWWSPLWDYCRSVAEELCDGVQYAYSNDGDGLDDEDSKALATILLDEYKSGRTKQYEEARQAELDEIPMETCEWCKGTGHRVWHSDKTGKKEQDFAGELLTPEQLKVYVNVTTRECNGCEGKGKRKPWVAEYHFSADVVKEFATFLRYCGGFHIW